MLLPSNRRVDIERLHLLAIEPDRRYAMGSEPLGRRPSERRPNQILAVRREAEHRDAARCGIESPVSSYSVSAFGESLNSRYGG